MAKNQGGNPTEKPTEKRKKQAYKKGQVAYSTKFAGVIQLTGFMLLILFFSGWLAHKLVIVAQYSFAGRISFSQSLLFGLSSLMELFIPLGLFLLVFSLAGGIAQVGFRFNYHMLMPKLSNISPKEGFKRIFSIRKLWDLGLAVVALLGVFLIIYFFLRFNLSRIISLGSATNLKVALENFSTLIVNFLLFLLLFLIFA
ncbi:MAG: EscU/YscU/HrcU family type III secretion system export apparatus switch protein, partial [Deltaproteobacteria bacterium]|nr:EscU/YscU/HrcU family type III secretion system export apparatus switch protein [Deltaproteobacteria bacterium]